MAGIFGRITNEVKNYRLDTSAAPNDKITKKIIELRELRGGFNINKAIHFKIEEEEDKKETPKVALDHVKEQFNNGKEKMGGQCSNPYLPRSIQLHRTKTVSEILQNTGWTKAGR